VSAVVEGIVNQFVRVSTALDALLSTSVDALLANLNLDTLDKIDLSVLDPDLLTNGIQKLDPSILEPLTCLILPSAGNVQLEQQPLDKTQEQSPFSFIMIILGAAQAIFFAMFTGIFGINSIYQEQESWTLKRLIASPTPKSFILAGKLLGNLVVVTAQMLILFISFTIIASIVEGEPTFIWGTNIPLFLAVLFGIGLFASGLGVLIVGLAKNSEQVQFFGPMIAATLGALGGSFGFRLPPEVAGLSPVWRAAEALRYTSTGEVGKVLPNLLILLATGVLLFGVGTVLFKRRIDL
jgi:ABC-type transport system involved in multi-copper enzyme maturation permease subunit